MDVRNQPRFSTKISSAGVISNTVVGMAAGQRWNLDTFNIAWIGATACTTFTIYEIDATNSSALFRFMATVTDGRASFYFGGAQASSTNTRLMFDTGVGSCAVTAHFTGWLT